MVQLLEKYPKDVRLVYRHFPLIQIHDKAQLSAEAAEAAGAQGKFWEMHEYLYNHGAEWSGLSPTDYRSWLKVAAGTVGLNVDQFMQDLDGGKFRAKVLEAYTTATTIGGQGLPGTPFILINGEPYQGPMELWSFSAMVELDALKDRQYTSPPPDVIDPARQYTATIKTEKGDIVIELMPEAAPVSVNSFVFLAREGWYDDITFHQVLSGVAALAGDPTGSGMGGPGYMIPDEIQPDTKYDAPGMVGLINSGANTNGSIFFITMAPLPQLDGRYTLFGKVTAGMDVVMKLSLRESPAAPPGDKIIRITIEEK